MDVQSVQLDRVEARTVLALVRERDRLQEELGETFAAIGALGEQYARKHQLPHPARYEFQGDDANGVRLVAAPLSNDAPPGNGAPPGSGAPKPAEEEHAVETTEGEKAETPAEVAPALAAQAEDE